jgi:ParB-like chromosome segregation protein Spo0J
MVKKIAIKELTSADVTSGAGAREHLTRGKETFKVEFEKIKIRTGWNVRTEMGDLEGLAKSMLANGQERPIKGDLLADGTFVPTDGHRRIAAVELIRKWGHEFNHILCELNPVKITDEQRLIQMWTSNDSKPLEPLEKAELCKRLVNIGYKPVQIAEQLGISRMHVDNYIVMAGLSIEEKEAIHDGTIKPTAAVKLAKAEPSAEKRKKVIKEAKAAGKVVKEKTVVKKAAKKKATAKKAAGDKDPIAMIDEVLAELKPLDKKTDADGMDIIFNIDKKLREIKKLLKNA